jgi:hypothetical protein
MSERIEFIRECVVTAPCVSAVPQLQNANSVIRKKIESPRSISHRYMVGQQVDVYRSGDNFVDKEFGFELRNLKIDRDYKLLK